MKLIIKSRKLNKEITFSRPGSHYIYADINGKEGTLGSQITHNGGSTIGYSGDSQEQFEKICRNWYRSYVKSMTY